MSKLPSDESGTAALTIPTIVAESENLTVSALKKEVKTRHPTTKRGKTRKAIIDLTSEEGLHHAMEKIRDYDTCVRFFREGLPDTQIP
jgi:DNA transposition AAA+ family ATPase